MNNKKSNKNKKLLLEFEYLDKDGKPIDFDNPETVNHIKNVIVEVMKAHINKKNL